MKQSQAQIVAEQFEMAEQSVDNMIKFWKHEGFTREQIMRATYALLLSHKKHLQMTAFAFAVLADRLIHPTITE